MMSCTTENSPPEQPIAPKPATQSKPLNQGLPIPKKGDRVVVAYDGSSLYQGIKGVVIKVQGLEVMVEFDEPVKYSNWTTFNLASGTVLMKLQA